jgi:hypothetical protein
LLYLAIHVVSFVQALRWYPRLEGKEQQICLTLILAKAGLFIPMFTANLESYLYVAYMMWIVNGWVVQIIGTRHEARGTRHEPASRRLGTRHEGRVIQRDE